MSAFTAANSSLIAIRHGKELIIRTSYMYMNLAHVWVLTLIGQGLHFQHQLLQLLYLHMHSRAVPYGQHESTAETAQHTMRLLCKPYRQLLYSHSCWEASRPLWQRHAVNTASCVAMAPLESAQCVSGLTGHHHAMFIMHYW